MTNVFGVNAKVWGNLLVCLYFIIGDIMILVLMMSLVRLVQTESYSCSPVLCKGRRELGLRTW